MTLARARPGARRIPAAAAVAAGVLLAAGTWTGQPADAAVPRTGLDAGVVCRFADPRLTEISGLAPSVRHPGILWAHNDSSGGPVLYALDARTCAVRAEVTVAGIDARDLEGLAAGRDAAGRAVLWVGDIGDNLDSWPEVRVHAVPEPARLRDRTVAAATYRFSYADGSHNAEALLAAPRRERLWVVTKQLARGGLWALPSPLSEGSVMVATRLGDENGLVTDGAVAPDGSRYVLRDYLDARVYRGLPPGPRLAQVELPVQPRGEAVAWAADGRALLVAGELDDRLLRVDLPRAAWTRTALAADAATTAAPEPGPAGSAPDAPPTTTAGSAPAAGAGGGGPVGWAAAAALVLAAVGLVVVVRRRGG